jgi:hypothetical protein
MKRGPERSGIAAMRGAVWIGIALLTAGVAAIFVPIALLVQAIGAGLAATSGAPAASSDMTIILFALPAGAVLGVVLVVAGCGVLVRVLRASRG